MLPTVFQRAQAANVTSATYATTLAYLVPGTTPAAPWIPACGRNFLELLPLGTGADNKTGSLRVLGAVPEPAGGWLVRRLADFSLTLSADTGSAGQPVLNTEFYCDTIALTTGTGASTIRILAGSDDVRGTIIMDLMESQFILVDFAVGSGGSAATALNAMYRFLLGGWGTPVKLT